MRLSEGDERIETHVASVIETALDAGVRFFDTAHAYTNDPPNLGHNERLVARVLAESGISRDELVVATKGGMSRPNGDWVPDGRAGHIKKACEASLRALSTDIIDLYQLHAPDPRVKFETSVRALASLRKAGNIRSVGLCNVSVSQLELARKITPIESVQVELNPWKEIYFRNGVAEYCRREGIRLIAHSPLGGPAARARLAKHALLQELAQSYGVTPQLIVLAWLQGLSRHVTTISGVRSVEQAKNLSLLRDFELEARDQDRLDATFPASRILRLPQSERRPDESSEGEVLILMGMPAAGKSSRVDELVEQGYQRLNRDEHGGRLSRLVPVLDERLRNGHRFVVLDNTYPERHTRNAVIETAWKHGVGVRCQWLSTPLAEAQTNAVERMLSRYQVLLGPEEIARHSRNDPNCFAPHAQFRYERLLERPSMDEGFVAVEEVAFERRPRPGYQNRAVLVDFEDILFAGRRRGERNSSPEPSPQLTSRAAKLQKYQQAGFLLLAVTWQPGARPEQIDDLVRRVEGWFGVQIEALCCPHGEGPPVCWCRKPLPGLGVVFIHRHMLDVAQCFVVGRSTADEGFAKRLGMPYWTHHQFFGES